MDHSIDNDIVVEQDSSSCSSQHIPDSRMESSSSSCDHHPRSVLLTSSDLNIIHSDHNHILPSNHYYSPTKAAAAAAVVSAARIHYPMDNNTQDPEYKYLVTLVGILLLSTSLASIAGLDAKIHCQSRQAYEINQLFDDDAVIFSQLQRVQEQHACVVMWRYVMLPVTVVTLMCGTMTLYLVRQQQQQSSPYPWCLAHLFLLSLGMLLSWSYGIIAIMLRPRNLQEDGNPYQSLAAVDNMGHVGDNANLYYLAWISVGLALAIVYQVSIDLVQQSRQQHHQHQQQQAYKQPTQTTTTTHEIIVPENVEATMLSYTSIQLQHYRQSRETWYNSLYRLRIRSGIWVSALLATSVVLASSLLLWRDVLTPTASKLMGNSSSSSSTLSVRGVCAILQTSGNSALPPELCLRTAFSIVSGGTAACLCIGAIVIHACTRHGAAAQVIQDSSCHPVLSIAHHSDHFTKQRRNIPLRTEFILSVMLSLLLGLNAVLATGVQGPAATVGNLYYASWISFLLCLRICMGCLEEVYNLGKKEKEEMTLSSSVQPTKSASSDTPSISPDLFDNERARLLRRYLALGIFSTACSASALDAVRRTLCTSGVRALVVVWCLSKFLSLSLSFFCSHLTRAVISVWTNGSSLSHQQSLPSFV